MGGQREGVDGAAGVGQGVGVSDDGVRVTDAGLIRRELDGVGIFVGPHVVQAADGHGAGDVVQVGAEAVGALVDGGGIALQVIILARAGVDEPGIDVGAYVSALVDVAGPGERPAGDPESAVAVVPGDAVVSVTVGIGLRIARAVDVVRQRDVRHGERSARGADARAKTGRGGVAVDQCVSDVGLGVDPRLVDRSAVRGGVAVEVRVRDARAAIVGIERAAPTSVVFIAIGDVAGEGAAQASGGITAGGERGGRTV